MTQEMTQEISAEEVLKKELEMMVSTIIEGFKHGEFKHGKLELKLECPSFNKTLYAVLQVVKLPHDYWTLRLNTQGRKDNGEDWYHCHTTHSPELRGPSWNYFQKELAWEIGRFLLYYSSINPWVYVRLKEYTGLDGDYERGSNAIPNKPGIYTLSEEWPFGRFSANETYDKVFLALRNDGIVGAFPDYGHAMDFYLDSQEEPDTSKADFGVGTIRNGLVTLEF